MTSLDGVPIDVGNYVMKLPMQVLQEEVSTIEEVQSTGSNTSLGTVISTFLLGLMSGHALGFLFSMIGSLQFICFLTVLNLDVPGNVSNIFSKLLKVMTFDWVPEWALAPWLNFATGPSTHLEDDLTEKFTKRFPDLGYSNSNPIVSLSSGIIPIGTLLGLFLGYPIMACLLGYTRFTKARQKFKSKFDKLKWNPPIRLVIEMHFELVLICAIRIVTFENDTTYEKAVTYGALAFFILLCLFSLYILDLSLFYKKRPHWAEGTYDTIYDDLDPTRPLFFLVNPIFLMGRIYFVIVIMWMQSLPSF